MIVFGNPGALHGVHGVIEVGDQRGGRKTGFERRRVDKRLERRARLTFRVDGPVEVALDEVPTADQGAHLATARIDRDERRLECSGIGERGFRPRAAARIEILQHPLHFGIGRSLHVEVDGRVDLESTLVHAIGAKPRRLVRAGRAP